MASPNSMILVSACLIGCKCRYDGADCLDESLRARWDRGELFAVCPEQLGGLPTPRPPAEIESGSGEDVLEDKARVLRENGEDVTDAFVAGARRTLDIARAVGAREAIFKQRSPACGCGQITRAGRTVEGNGVTTALLAREGLRIVPHE